MGNEITELPLALGEGHGEVKGFTPFWKFQLAGWGAYLVLSFPTKVLLLGSVRAALITTFVRDGLAFLITLGMRAIYCKAYGRHWPILGNAILIGIVSLLAGWALALFSLALDHKIALEDAVLFGEVNTMRMIYFCASVFMCWSLLYFGIRYMRAAADREVQLARVETEQQRAELQLLRVQMNPHFILNALTALRAEASHPGQRLKDLLQALADYLRYSLDNRNRDQVPIGSEFDAIKGYLAIEKARFRDELEIECRLEESARNKLVPGVFILPLVDNAIKYGRKTSPLPLRVRLTVSQPEPSTLRVEVANTGTWVDEQRPRPFGGFGLENLRRRLALLYPGKDCLRILKEAGWVTVQVDIPA
ncbi:MAG: histidine kinase [Terrimicrobiaceae bacterium]|nr:histidine kinase [Terrimicrobiaceae bacterium]